MDCLAPITMLMLDSYLEPKHRPVSFFYGSHSRIECVVDTPYKITGDERILWGYYCEYVIDGQKVVLTAHEIKELSECFR